MKVETLFGAAPKKLKEALSRHRGEPYDTTGEEPLISSGNETRGLSRDRYINEVKDFFSKPDGVAERDRLYGVNQKKSLYVKTTYVTDCVTTVPAAECQTTLKDQAGNPVSKCLDITVKIKVIPIDTENLSANLLDLARSNKLRFYRELPRPLLLFNPTFWVEQDRDYGVAAVANVSTDLLHLSPPKAEESGTHNTQLRLALSGRKSLDKRFYNTTSSLTLSRIRSGKLLENVGLKVGFAANQQPQGDGIRQINAMRIGGSTTLKFDGGPFSQLSLGAGYRRANNRFVSRTGLPAERTSEDAFESRAILDGDIARGFIRGAVWFDGASPNKGFGSYQRLAATVGYSKDFVLPQQKCRIVKVEVKLPGRDEVKENDACEFPEKNPAAIGAEMQFGAGRAWGSVPEYARFYGGNSTGNFLYDAVNEPSLTDMPGGPLIRSFGRNKAGVRRGTNLSRGGTSYWHFNLSLSLPVRKWSRPLIPAETVAEQPDDQNVLSCTGCTSLKEAFKNQVSGEKNIFIDALAIRKLSLEQRDDLALDRTDGLTPEQEARLQRAEEAFEKARKEVKPEADKVWARLTPTINYIADNANFYSVKPLIMFDAANLSARGEPDQRTRLALGGGLQLNVVVAKFQVGYLRTVRRVPGDERGNFVIRMVFEKLF
ncbi:MAG TPA: hypothetical protein VJ866_12040 [Pyrinomonadaceae bacterium]|nr:hypothetical protein [Pyrinomonadaceae bacterium]